jgi:tetratricopeptide (TPR) repeat protein
MQIQSHKAVASLDQFPLWSRMFFACYVLMIYFIRFIFPYPLSNFHPYPPHDNLGLAVYLSPLFIAALVFFIWYFRKNKLVVFSILFYVTNLLLVLQIIAIGNTIVSERYTYVPYIGLAFLLGYMLNEIKNKKTIGWISVVAVTLVFGTITYQRTQVWKDSETLWTAAIKVYPTAPVPRTNRSNVYSVRLENPAYNSEATSLMQKVIDDCNVALKSDPSHARGYEDRGIVYLRMSRNEDALADGNSLIRIAPANKLGYQIRGSAYFNLNETDKALADFTKGIELFPDDDFSFGKRGALLFNKFQKYSEARADFDKAISIKPSGNYYINRSYCNYRLGDTAKAREDFQAALQLGEKVSDAYRKMLFP